MRFKELKMVARGRVELATALCRHADFQSIERLFLTQQINQLPGRSLQTMPNNAGLCSTDSRKTHAVVQLV